MLLLGGCGHPVKAPEPLREAPAEVTTAGLLASTIDPLIGYRACFLATCIDEVGTQEATGRNDGERVEQYLRSVNLGPGYPWCAAFPHWAARQCGRTFEPTREFAMAARWHVRSARIWERKGWNPDTAEWRPVSAPGDHLAIYYKNLGRIGHTAVIIGEDEKFFRTVEGNTNAEGSREGNGVFIRKRLKASTYCVSRW